MLKGQTLKKTRTLVSPERVVFQKGGFGGCAPRTKTGTRVHSDVPPERKLERGYVRIFPRNENRNEVHSPKPPFYETAPLSSSDRNREKWPIHGYPVCGYPFCS